MKRKIFLTIFIILLASFSVFAQDYEAGKISDLKGLTKIYIDADGDLKNKERIIKKIQKARIEKLEIVEDEESAEIVLIFGGRSKTAIVSANTRFDGGYAVTTPMRVSFDEGEGSVFVRGKTGKPRLVFRYRNEQDSKLEDTPAVKIAAEFVRYYRQANGLKND
jgi:hypothetical protein